MTTWTAVSRSTHAGKHWRPRKGFEFAAANQVVPIVLAELTKLLPHYVLGFIKSPTGGYQPVALLGIGGSRNLYVAPDSQWLCNYVPTEYQAYPFTMLADSNGTKVFCIADQALSDDANLPALFTTGGDLDTQAAERFNFIAQCEQSRQATIKAVAALEEADVIEPWAIAINRQGGEPLNINGLYRINEKAMNALKAETFTGLRNSGGLIMAYAQIFSAAQMNQLTQRAEYLTKANALKTSPQGIDNLFSSQDSGTLNFDAFEMDTTGKS